MQFGRTNVVCMNNLFGFGCQQLVYRTSSSNNTRPFGNVVDVGATAAPAAAATVVQQSPALPSIVVPPQRRRLSSSTANLFRRLFGLPIKYKAKKSSSIVLSTASASAAAMASIEATPNRGPSKQQNQISGQLYKYTNVVKGIYFYFDVTILISNFRFYIS